MPDLLAIAATAMGHDMARLAALSHNLANATTPAYRREVVATRPFGEVMLEHGSGVALRVPAGIPTTTLDVSPATLRSTGAALDVAIEGDGWFELRGPAGPVYTRRGDFTIDATGRLASASGLPVMGSDGEIVLAGGALRIDAAGRIFEDERPAGQLRVVGFAQPAALEPLGEGLVADPLQSAQRLDTARLRQGHLENANVSATGEMVRLIETMRRFEAHQRLIQSYDDSLGRAIRALGET